MSKPNPAVDRFFEKVDKWQAELSMLRALVLECGLCEELKWGKPCYTLDGSNVAILYRFKDFCAVGFFKGALLEDPEGLLVAPGEHSQAMRRLQFGNTREVSRRKTVIKKYVRSAISAERAGLEVDFAEKRQLEIPPEMARAFSKKPALEAAFARLTPGRQRSYVLHVSGAKQAATRAARVEKCVPKILLGKGFNER